MNLKNLQFLFLKEESKNLLFENGYDLNRIRKEFGNDEIKLIHQALKFYGNTINKNQ